MAISELGSILAQNRKIYQKPPSTIAEKFLMSIYDLKQTCLQKTV